MIPTLVAMFIWAVVHSLAAGADLKNRARRRLGERAYFGLYRLGYNLFAAFTFAPVLWIALTQSSAVVWRISPGWIPVSLVVQAVGLIGLIVSLMQVDFARFAGLSQVRAYATGAPLPLPAEPLRTGGLYSFVRHPLYLFSMLAIWPLPVMTDGLLALDIAATLYFIVGSRFEERRLVAAFGEEYVQYRRTVPWLIPTPRSFTKLPSNRFPS